MRKSRSERKSKGTGLCTRCGKAHPKGKKRRARLKAAGKWGGCKIKVKDAVTVESGRKGILTDDKRKAKNRRTKERNLLRKEERRIKAEERQKYWSGLTLEQKLAELNNRPGSCAKQIKKLLG